AALCAAPTVVIDFVEGEHLRRVALHGAVGSYLGMTSALDRTTPAAAAVIEGRTAYVTGRAEEIAPSYPGMAAFMQERGWIERTVLAVPLLPGSGVVGVLAAIRRDRQGFTATQKALVETFAAQAVVAIENARLFDELEQRNREQAEALEREQATGGGLRGIAGSPEGMEASLQAVGDTARRRRRGGGRGVGGRGRRRPGNWAAIRGAGCGGPVRARGADGAHRGRSPSTSPRRRAHRPHRARLGHDALSPGARRPSGASGGGGGV